MSLVYKLYDVEIKDIQKICEEQIKSQNLFAPIKVGFGQYTPQTKTREVLVLRSLNADYEERRYPNILPNYMEDVAKWDKNSERFPYTKKWINDLVKHFQSPIVGKVMFAKMPPGGTMNWHVDPYPTYGGFSRLHVPLLSSRGASNFYTENGDFSMQLGGAYLYDTVTMHTAKNNSLQDRVHLIVDLFLPREKYFPKVHYFWEEIFFQSYTKLESGQIFFERGLESNKHFPFALEKFGTLLIFLGVEALPESQYKFSFLWTSSASKEKFYEDCDIVKSLKSLDGDLLIKNGTISWEQSYDFVKTCCLSSEIVVCRRDYR